MNRYHVYTDGACVPNPGVGGWAFVIEETKEAHSGKIKQSTNNRAELIAICKALIHFAQPSEITIYTDSAYVILIAQKKIPPTINYDLWKLLRELMSYHYVDFRKVRGHAGVPLNELCDGLANRAATR